MFHRVRAAVLTACALLPGTAVLVGQDPKAQKVPGSETTSSVEATGPSAALACVGCELPIILRQSVEAGKTAVGTKVEARLTMATMMTGGVLPRGTVISGEVIESMPKSATSPSRLAIRMDSAQWKNGGAKLRVYLMPWYYPPAPMAPPNISYVPQGDRRNWGGRIPPSIPPIHRIRRRGCRLSRTMVSTRARQHRSSLENGLA